ncbi:TetR/AcrR family transcriptional regulator [Cohaesibacter haloalkalitolerans]|uniref:TetR/AcrR family transcriptional regulator n=1 Tax=Cohaesibacter haloalkalitolerans TaxID=1162980 RepID=UPI000E65DD8C|nr:TetR/AcrR family transcriptional regulator [Cohaesibacter haloalkalitolerans]
MSEKKTRRRGEALEHAILDAAWEEVVVHGFQHYTVEGVVKRAQTSRSVVYRRWSNKIELFEAALLHYFQQNRPAVPDQGSLRDDLVSLLDEVCNMRGHMMMILASQMVEYYRETSVRPVDLREKITLASNSVLDRILFRAVERGEISSQPLPARLKHLPFDLLRSEFFMTWQQPDKSKIVEIVDMIVMPAIEYQQKLLMDEAMRTYALSR